MSNATATRKGRRLDGTPNKVFSEKIVQKHDDGTVTYEKTFNDENGERQVVQERRQPKKRGGGGGRGIDLTPNREFTPRKVKDNDDGTAVYVIPYNDENGVRHEREEVRTPKARGGHRKPDSSPSKVISGIKTERIANDTGDGGSNDVVMSVPYNDKDGERQDGYVILSVNSKGNLTAKVVQDKPEVYVRQRNTESADGSGSDNGGTDDSGEGSAE